MKYPLNIYGISMLLMWSAEIALGGLEGGITTLNPQLPRTLNLGADVGLVACVGIEFLQELNGDFYLLAQGNALKVVEVF